MSTEVGFGAALWALFAGVALVIFLEITEPTWIRQLGDFIVGVLQ